MSNTKSIKSTVPMTQKIAFGIGMLANQMFPAALGIFMVVLVENLGMPSWMWGVLFFVPRIVDAFFDPIMGFISDNTKSVWGRRRQYVFIGSLIMGIAFMIMWQLFREDSVMYNFTFFLIWSLIFHIGLSIFSVPYVAMGYEMSDDFHERTSIMAVSQWIGQWAWVIAPWFWVIMYDPNWFPNADTATRTIAIWVGSIFMLLAMVPAVFIKSKSTKFDDTLQPLTFSTIGGSLKDILISFKEAFSNKPFRKLCIATFLIFNAFNTVAGFTFFIVVYYLFNGDAAAAGIWPTLFGCGGALATTFVVIPIVAWIAKKMEKKKAFLICQGISIFGYILLWFLFIPGKPYMFLFALPFFSFGIGSLFTLMMSMTADVCDMDELESGKRREGVFGAIYWWMVKFGFAIAGLLTGVIMSVVAFKAGAPTQPEGAVTGLRLFFSGVPILGTLIAMVVMWNYDLTEKKARDIKKELDSRKAKLKSSDYSSTSIIGDVNLKELTKTELKSKFPHFHAPSIDYNNVSNEAIADNFKTQFSKGIHGICFSAYNEFQNPGDTITKDQIVKRLELLKGHTKWIRTFSCTNGHELIPQLAREMGFKTLVGAWISKDLQQNEIELSSLKRLLQTGMVDMASVGNETLFRNDIDPKTLKDYILQIKDVAGIVPVGFVDVYYEVVRNPDLISVSDVLMINCYPYWEGADIRFALFYLQEMYKKVLQIAGTKKIIITETGWPTDGQIVKDAEPSKTNVMRYVVEIFEWVQKENIEMFYFSSFDESWKIHFEGWTGTSWGLWDKNEKFKYK